MNADLNNSSFVIRNDALYQTRGERGLLRATKTVIMFCDGDFNPDTKQAVYRNGGINPYSITN